MKKPKEKTVYLKVEGGVVDVYRIPRGVRVEVIEHDAEPPEDEGEGVNGLGCKCKEGGGTWHEHMTHGPTQ